MDFHAFVERVMRLSVCMCDWRCLSFLQVLGIIMCLYVLTDLLLLLFDLLCRRMWLVVVYIVFFLCVLVDVC